MLNPITDPDFISKIAVLTPPPIEDARWFCLPGKKIAIAVPIDWGVIKNPDAEEWLIDPEIPPNPNLPRPCLHFKINNIADPSPENVMKSLRSMKNNFENSQSSEILKKIHDPKTILPTYGYRYSFASRSPTDRRMAHKSYVGFLTSGYILTLNATAPIPLWNQFWPIMEAIMRNLLIMETVVPGYNKFK